MKKRYTLKSHIKTDRYIMSRIMSLKSEIKRAILEPYEIVEITKEIKELEKKLRKINKKEEKNDRNK